MDNILPISTEIIRGKSPEEEELKEKELKLAELEDELINCQLKLSTLQFQINSFENSYHRIVGILYAELDEIKAQIAEAQLALNPVDKEAIDKATAFRAFAEESSEEAKRITEHHPRPDFEPPDSLKKLFREAAKRIHPDLANNESERLRRHHTMTQINSAYEAGDEVGMKNILQDWNDFQSAQEGGVSAKLLRAMRKITQVENSIRQLEADIDRLQKSDIGILFVKSKQAEWKNRNIFLEMAAGMRADIAKERERLAALAS